MDNPPVLPIGLQIKSSNLHTNLVIDFQKGDANPFRFGSQFFNMKRSNTLTLTTLPTKRRKYAKTATTTVAKLPDYQPRNAVPASRATAKKEVHAISIVPALLQPFSTTGYLSPLLIQIPTGDEYNQRNGRTVRLLDAAWTINTLNLAGQVSAYNTFYRVVIFKWSQPGLVPLTNAILDSGNIYGQYAQIQVPNYKILSDQTYGVKQDAVGTQDVRTLHGGKCKLGFEVDFPNGANPNAVTNCVYMLVIATDAVGTFTVKANVRFIDL